jgi:hypothetical protein
VITESRPRAAQTILTWSLTRNSRLHTVRTPSHHRLIDSALALDTRSRAILSQYLEILGHNTHKKVQYAISPQR